MLGRKNSQPQVWHRFVQTMEDGSLLKLKVQDIPEERFDDIVQFMIDNFVTDETFFNSSDLRTNKEIRNQFKNFWRWHILPQKISLVCFEDSDEEDWCPKIYAVDCLRHVVKDHQEIPEGFNLPPLFGDMIHLMQSQIDIFSMYNINEYIGDIGLCVDISCRGMDIGLELLNARIPLCQAIGIQAIESILTATNSQLLAEKAGYISVLEVKYEEIAAKLNIQIPEDSPKVVKMMTKIIK